MKKEYVTTASDYGKSAIKANKELVEINGRLMSKMLESQISLASVLVESGEKQMAAAANVKDPKTYVETQTALLEEYAAKLTETAQSNAKLAQEAGEQLKAWFEKSVKTADEAVKEAAVKAGAPMTSAKKPVAKPAVKKTAPKKAAPAATKPAAKTAVKAAKPVAKKAPAKAAAKPVATKAAATKPAVKKAPAKKAAPKAAATAPAPVASAEAPKATE